MNSVNDMFTSSNQKEYKKNDDLTESSHTISSTYSSDSIHLKKRRELRVCRRSSKGTILITDFSTDTEAPLAGGSSDVFVSNCNTSNDHDDNLNKTFSDKLESKVSSSDIDVSADTMEPIARGSNMLTSSYQKVCKQGNDLAESSHTISSMYSIDSIKDSLHPKKRRELRVRRRSSKGAILIADFSTGTEALLAGDTDTLFTSNYNTSHDRDDDLSQTPTSMNFSTGTKAPLARSSDMFTSYNLEECKQGDDLAESSHTISSMFSIDSIHLTKREKPRVRRRSQRGTVLITDFSTDTEAPLVDSSFDLFVLNYNISHDHDNLNKTQPVRPDSSPKATSLNRDFSADVKVPLVRGYGMLPSCNHNVYKKNDDLEESSHTISSTYSIDSIKDSIHVKKRREPRVRRRSSKGTILIADFSSDTDVPLAGGSSDIFVSNYNISHDHDDNLNKTSSKRTESKSSSNMLESSDRRLYNKQGDDLAESSHTISSMYSIESIKDSLHPKKRMEFRVRRRSSKGTILIADFSTDTEAPLAGGADVVFASPSNLSFKNVHELEKQAELNPTSLLQYTFNTTFDCASVDDVSISSSEASFACC